VEGGHDEAKSGLLLLAECNARYLRTARNGDNMKLGLTGTLRVAIGAVAVSLIGMALAGGQAPPASPAGASGQAASAGKTLMVEDVFKNIQILKGIPVDQFMGTMGFFAASLSVNCTECHTGNFEFDTPQKKKAREMLLMVQAINKDHFGGQRVITCYTCHRSDTTPKFWPSLAEQYGMPPDPDPNNVDPIGPVAPGALTPEKMIDRYIDALGGAQKLAGFTGYAAKGTYSGFDTDLEKVPAEMYAQAPGSRTWIAHREGGDDIWVYDGHRGWMGLTNTRLPLTEFSGGNLDGNVLDAMSIFPLGLKQSLTRMRAGFPPMTVDDKDVDVLQGFAPNGTRVKLFFDKKTGLLVRQARFAVTAVGLNPSQVDYADYRDVNGVKVPFHWTYSWTDGRSDFDITDFQANAKIDPSKFVKPNLPEMPQPPPERPARPAQP